MKHPERAVLIAELTERLAELAAAEERRLFPFHEPDEHPIEILLALPWASAEALLKFVACRVARMAPSVVVQVYCSGGGDGGVGFRGRAGASRLEGSLCLHDLSALHLRSGSALSHDGWLQHPAATAPSRGALEEEVQPVGSDLAVGSWLVS